MEWEVVGGRLIIGWHASALLFTVAIIGVLFLLRFLSLRILNAEPEFRDRDRYIRGARWGWLLVAASFVVVVVAMTVFAGHTQWDLRAVAIAWLAALLPISGSAGLLLIEEFMGFWVGGQAVWDALHKRRIDLIAYRATASRTATSNARWGYYAAWVIGSIGLTAGPMMVCAAQTC